ncbi:hypothetical protein GCM10020258_22470 [Sphingomonas yabuuchiae]
MIFKLLGLNRDNEDQVTAEELHLIVAEASKSGVIEEHERSIISGVVRLADRPVREVMTPRTEIDWLDCTLDDAAIRAKLLESPRTRLPVGRARSTRWSAWCRRATSPWRCSGASRSTSST